MRRRTWFKTLTTLSLVTLFATTAVYADQDFGFEEGVEYRKIPQQQSIAPHTKQVTEVFYYGCKHCYNLEPSLHNWLKDKPADIHFEQVPAVLNNPNWIFMAKVFYTSKELGVLEQSHLPFFTALHRDRQSLFSVEEIAEFFTQFGVKQADFIATFKSFKVDQMVRQAMRTTQAYGIDGVPAIIVNGQYLTDVPMAQSTERMWQLVNKLTTK